MMPYIVVPHKPEKTEEKFHRNNTYYTSSIGINLQQLKFNNELVDSFNFSFWPNTWAGYKKESSNRSVEHTYEVSREELKELADLIYQVIGEPCRKKPIKSTWGIK